MLKVSNLNFSYSNNEILKNISFSLRPGTITAVLGVNGSGKTTLLKALNGIETPSAGSVILNGKDVKEMSSSEKGQKFGYMPQKNQGVKITVYEAVLLGRKPYINWHLSIHDLEVVDEILNVLGLAAYSMRFCNELSGGELQKVVMARALVQRPAVLLLDEPSNHLDIRNQLEIMTLLQKVTLKMSLITMIVLHDLAAAMRFCNNFLLLKAGRVYACGNREVINPKSMQEVFGMVAHLGEIEGIPAVLPVRPC